MKKSTRLKKGFVFHRNGKSLIEAVKSGIFSCKQAWLDKGLQPGELHLHPTEVLEGVVKVEGLIVFPDRFVEPGYLIIFSVRSKVKFGAKKGEAVNEQTARVKIGQQKKDK
jgi:hypothetical protein